jgi:hypothetical protein
VSYSTTKRGLRASAPAKIAPVALSGVAGAQVIPACHHCGQATARVNTWMRRCPDGHTSRLVTIAGATWQDLRWEVVPCV